MKSLVAFLSLSTLVTALWLPSLPEKHPKRAPARALQVSTMKMYGWADPSPDNVVEALPLINGGPSTRSVLPCVEPPKGGPFMQEVVHYGNIEFLTTIKIDGSPVTLVVDTGSSDTWAITKNYQCYSEYGFPLSQKYCNFSVGVETGFSAENKIEDVQLEVHYGDRTWAKGDFGYSKIEMAGLTIPKQQVALVNQSFWRGMNESCGLMGLAYPRLTSAFIKGNHSNRLEYKPLFTTMWETNITSPTFSLALKRGGVGSMAFGGIPPVPTSGEWAKARIWLSQIAGQYDYAFYTIKPDNWIYTGSDIDQTKLYITDSGTTISWIEGSVVRGLVAAITPPPTIDPWTGMYILDCTATVPSFGIQIGGKPFMMHRDDIVLKLGAKCYLGFQDAALLGFSMGSNVAGLLGDTFLNSVLAVHDIAGAEMRFIQHVY